MLPVVAFAHSFSVVRFVIQGQRGVQPYLRLAYLSSDRLVVWPSLVANSTVPEDHCADRPVRVHWFATAHGLERSFVLVRTELLVPLSRPPALGSPLAILKFKRREEDAMRSVPDTQSPRIRHDLINVTNCANMQRVAISVAAVCSWWTRQGAW
jgi:hypothetical protein